MGMSAFEKIPQVVAAETGEEVAPETWSENKMLRDSVQSLLLRNLPLARLVALVDSGELDKFLPPIEPGDCDWCHSHGPTMALPDLLVKGVCQDCFSIGLEAIRAAAAGDTQAYSAMEKELNLRWVNRAGVVH